MTDPRVGQPPLDPAHPGWTLPIPPDAPTLDATRLREIITAARSRWHTVGEDIKEEYGGDFYGYLAPYLASVLRGALPPDRPTPAPTMRVHRRDDTPETKAMWDDIESVALRAGGQPVSATPEPTQDDVRELWAVLNGDQTNKLFGMDECREILTELAKLRAKRLPVSATPPEPDAAKMDAALAVALECWPEGSKGRNDVLKLWQATLEFARAGASPQPEDSRP